jgi:hypothetical protein
MASNAQQNINVVLAINQTPRGNGAVSFFRRESVIYRTQGHEWRNKLFAGMQCSDVS